MAASADKTIKTKLLRHRCIPAGDKSRWGWATYLDRGTYLSLDDVAKQSLEEKAVEFAREFVARREGKVLVGLSDNQEKEILEKAKIMVPNETRLLPVRA